jgi:hypothetical protein
MLIPVASSNDGAPGPLRVHPTNPRYFTADGKSAVFLTGAHTWNNLVDMGRSDPPEAFDFDGYLDFLERHHHNFVRLWAWDSTTWDTQANGSLGKDFIHNAAPLPWLRTGPGNALDGKPKFDLSRFNPDYFDRLRSRLEAASRRGVYVSVMFFEGWGLFHGNRRRNLQQDGWAWLTHSFNPQNNVNGLRLETSDDRLSAQVHRVGIPAINALQLAYIHKVVDTLNDLDNVLYEVINEGGQKEWDWWVVDAVHEYEKTKPKQHPVGITGHGAERVDSMLASPADWISPGGQDGYGNEPPAWDGRKVSLLDTDHIWGCGGNPGWVWRSFTRGHNVLFMDTYDGSVLGNPSDTWMEPIRQAMGVARRVAEESNLAALIPRGDLASTGYCLADPGKEYVVYQPADGAFTIRLAAGTYRVVWIRPVDGKRVDGGSLAVSDGERTLTPPFDGEAVVHLK